MNARPFLLIALLTVSACSSHNSRSPTSVVESTLPATTSTSVLSVSTSTASTAPASTVPPTSIAAGSDWATVVQVLGQRRQDLYTAPDVKRIPEVCGDQSQCANQLKVQIGDLATKGWKVTGADPFAVVNARVEKFDGDTLDASLLVTVVAVIQRPATAGTIVDATGSFVANVQAQTSAGHNAQGRFLLARVGPADDPWRLVSQDTLPEVPA